VAALSSESPLKLATPFTALTVASPDSAAPPGLADSATVTAPLKAVAALPSASSAWTFTEGTSGAPATELAGATA